MQVQIDCYLPVEQIGYRFWLFFTITHQNLRYRSYNHRKYKYADNSKIIIGIIEHGQRGQLLLRQEDGEGYQLRIEKL